MPFTQADLDAVCAQIANTNKSRTVKKADREVHTEQVSLGELLQRKAIIEAALNANQQRTRSTLASFRKGWL